MSEPAFVETVSRTSNLGTITVTPLCHVCGEPCSYVYALRPMPDCGPIQCAACHERAGIADTETPPEGER